MAEAIDQQSATGVPPLSNIQNPLPAVNMPNAAIQAIQQGPLSSITGMPGPNGTDQGLAGIMQAIQGTQSKLTDAMSAQGGDPYRLPGMDNPFRQAGAGIASFSSGFLGRDNPVLKEAKDRQDALIAAQKERLAEQKWAYSEKKGQNEMALTMLKETLETPDLDPDVRAEAAKTYAKILGDATGVPVPDAVVSRWGRNGLTDKVVSAFNRDVVSGVYTDQELAQKYRIPQDKLATMKAYAQSNVARRAAGLPTIEEDKSRALDLQEKERKAWVEQHPELKDGPGEKGKADFAAEFVQRIYGKRIETLTGENPQDAAILRQAQDYAEKRAKSAYASGRALTLKEKGEDLRQAEDIRTQGEIARDKARIATTAATPKALKPPTQREADLALKPFESAAQNKTTMDAMSGALQRMQDKNLLPTGPSAMSGVVPNLRRDWLYTHDQDVVFMNQLTAPMFIGQIDRNLFDEKGSRSMQAFQQQIELVKKMPTREAYQGLIDFYNDMFQRKAERQLRLLERQRGKISDEIIDEAEQRYKETYGALPANPLGPLSPSQTQQPPAGNAGQAPGGSPLSPRANVLTPEKRQQLKAAGFSDVQIEAYKRAKGLQ